MKNKFNYDFFSAAVLIQAAVRGHCARKPFQIAKQRTAMCCDDILQEMKSICPEYDFIDGMDVLIMHDNGQRIHIPILPDVRAKLLPKSPSPAKATVVVAGAPASLESASTCAATLQPAAPTRNERAASQPLPPVQTNLADHEAQLLAEQAYLQEAILLRVAHLKKARAAAATASKG